MQRVFISHSSEDRQPAQQLCDLLEKRGLACWIAPRDVQPGREYASEIIAGIESCDAIVLVLSEHANESKFVKREIERAVSRDKPVFPVRIREVQPSASLELFISSSHWIDAFKPPMDQYLDRLVKSIQTLGEAPKPTKAGGKVRRAIPWGDGSDSKGGWIAGIVVAVLLLVAGGIYLAPRSSGSGAGAGTGGGETNAVAATGGSDASAGSAGSTNGAVATDILPGMRSDGRLDTPVSDTPAAIAHDFEPLDITDLLTLARQGRRTERSKQLRAIESRLPDRLTAAQVADLAGYDGTNDESRYVDDAIWLGRRVQGPQPIDELLTLLAPVSRADRQRLLRGYSQNLPPQISIDQAAALAKYGGTNDEPRYSEDLLWLESRLLPVMPVDATVTALKPLTRDLRGKTLRGLADHLPGRLAMPEVVSLVQYGGTNDEDRYGSDLVWLATRAPRPTPVDDLLAALKPLRGKLRGPAIEGLAPLIPATLTFTEAAAIAGYSGTNDEPRYSNSLLFLASRVKEPLDVPTMLTICKPLSGDLHRTTLKGFEKNIPETLTFAQASALARYTRTNDEGRYLDDLVWLLQRVEEPGTVEEFIAALRPFGHSTRFEALKRLIRFVPTIPADQLNAVLGSIPSSQRQEASEMLLPKVAG